MRKKNTADGTGSVRRDRTASRALRMNLPSGFYPLDCYNDVVLTDGSCFAITTRVSGCNNYFLLEIYEDDCDIQHQEAAE